MTEPESEPEPGSVGGRVFFARARRAPDRDHEIRLVSVGVDIGSATSHLVFSRLVLLRRGGRAEVVRRELLHASDIALTPYAGADTIDVAGLRRFVAGQYERAGIDPAMIDTGALILTGLAAGTRNARAIGALFAREAGRFVAVAAGCGLEATLAAHGSGATAASRHLDAPVMNVDIGGGTSKIAICEAGAVTDLTAIDIGARLIRLDADDRVSGLEPAGRALAEAAGIAVVPGAVLSQDKQRAIAAVMAARLFEACRGGALSPATAALLRLAPLSAPQVPAELRFSGGVAEYIAGREARRFGDLGPVLAEAVAARFAGWGPVTRLPDAAVRATVIGASQHSVQLSGNTIFVDPAGSLPLANLPVIVPGLALDDETIDPDSVADAVRLALRRLGLDHLDLDRQAVAIAYRWRGPATHARLDGFCSGLLRGLSPSPETPVVLVGEADIGGIVGRHLRAVHPRVVSLDGIAVIAFDFIDIGEILQVSGGVPVVVRSLVFPEPPA